YYEPAYAGYSFAGWYIDEACTQPYAFTAMPEGGITVYAKWVQTQYRVFLHPNVPKEDSTLDWGGQNMSFRVDYGDKVAGGNMIKGTRTNYDIIGWYKDEACTDPFDFSSFTLNDNTVTAAYDQTQSTELDKYGNAASDINSDAQNNRTWITKKLDLYAKWREVLIGARGIDVVYDAVEGKGTNAPTDPNQYLDNSEAIVQAASTATSDEEQFLYWVVQTWSGGAFTDTDQKVYPGDTFVVLKANARQEDIEPTQEYPDVTKKYTVQLRAEYGPKDAPTPTHINWYSNVQNINGNAMALPKFTHDTATESEAGKGWYVEDTDLQINESVPIRPADTYAYPGYTFLGWAKSRDADADHLFLKYEDGVFKAKIDGKWTAVEKVAADEHEPIDDLYAIWDAGEFYIYHSGLDNTQTIETIAFGDQDSRWNDDDTFDLTGKLTEGTLYGGYCDEAGSLSDNDFTSENVILPEDGKAYDGSNWTWSTMATAAGSAMNPETGHTYVIKEVPERYLAPKTFTYYKKVTDILQQMYIITIIDDTNYSNVGFSITIGSGDSEDRKEAVSEGSTVYKSFTVGKLTEETDDNGNITYKYDASSPGQVFKPSYGYGKEFFDADDYLYVNQLFASEEACAAQAGRTITIVPFWITKDSMKTDAVTKRTLAFGSENKFADVVFTTTGNGTAAITPQTVGEAGRAMRVVESAVLGADEIDRVLFEVDEETGTVAMHRLYNPNSGEHFYTGSVLEKNALVEAGWKYEDIAWYAPEFSDTPVYRLYNPNAGDHHYTVSTAEKDALMQAGWSYEGIGWYSADNSADSSAVPLYRLYNPNAYLTEGGSGAHHYTVSEEERDSLTALGWQEEGISWYGVEVNA
ncbi:MAG: InlB B-repeat-containing protein, partial [Firmicutes bacterium]|nr:InlB B-repeat-containing protein [Bacillota bacterium]